MQKDSFSQRLGPRLRGDGILERDLDCVCNRTHDIGREQRLGMGSENLRNAADIRGDHRNSRRGRLDYNIGHRIPARWNDQQPALGEAVPRLDVANEAHRLGKTELSNLSLESLEFLTVTGERQREGFAIGVEPRHRIDQKVGALDMPELADIDDIGGISRPDHRIELVGGYAIEHANYQPARRADRAPIGIAREYAFEHE